LEPIVQLREVALALATDPERSVRFDLPEFSVAPGEAVALTGPSGCGKSTLLNLIAGLRRPDAGHLRVAGRDLDSLTPAALDRHRGSHCGLVFQSFHLLAPFTALENVAIGLRFGTRLTRGARQIAADALCRVGLSHRLHSRPAQLSVGERQRVAIARAIAGSPRLLLADEPTGALDQGTGREIIDLLREVSSEGGRTLLMVTHDPALAAGLPRVFNCSGLVKTHMREKGAVIA
jgi:putative ABC transport system ATP-binding protein